jgi:hypothetical protein
MGTLKVDNIKSTTITENAASPITLSGDNATLSSNVNFPAGHIIQTVLENGTNTTHEISASTTLVASTVSDITISNVLASSKCIVWFWSGAKHTGASGYMDIVIYNVTNNVVIPKTIPDSGISGKDNISMIAVSGSTYNYGVSPLVWVIDDTPATGTNRYRVSFRRDQGSGNVYHHHGNDAPHYQNMVQEIAQ